LARIPIWDESNPDTPEEIRDALAHVEEVFGPPLNIQREMANHPEMVKRFSELAAVSYGENSTITGAERELAYTTTTVVNNCHY
jgi:alkylhydroperoxidase family enzyme